MVTAHGADIAGRYRLTRRAGSGGSGTVYVAADLLLGRTVAVKCLHDAYPLDMSRREGQALARLEHPNVVAVHDLIVEGGRAYLILEYVDGCDLDRWLREHATLSLDAALELFRSIAGAVEHAHACGLLHCDLKPANILISHSGEAKLTDFTLAQVRRKGSFAGVAGGTEEYAAPEQLQGTAVDERTDVYGLGAVLDRIGRSVTGEVEVRAVIDAVTSRAMASDPADRFRSVGEMIEALPARAGGATRIVPVTTASEMTRVDPLALTGTRNARIRDTRRSRWPLLSIPAASLLSVVGLWVHLSASASPPPVVLPSLVSADVGSARLVTRSFALHDTVVWQYSASTPRSVVIDQRPPAGISVPQGSTVTLIVSRGPRPVPVPEIVDTSEDAAVARLHALGFRVVLQQREAAFGPTHSVLAQSPGAGVHVLPHSVVVLTVSRAPWWEFWRSG
ncbi:MAG: Stk1 family PASTA domain-containing Ser/Thr kinase [Chloroflexota bacterium]